MNVISKFLFLLLIGAPLFGSYNTFVPDELVERAKEVRQRAYAPYSNYLVGAALLTDEGEIFEGCNVENASYGLTICAERTALFAAVAQGKKNYKSIAIVTKDGGAPCGACRQALNEFNPEMIVMLADENGVLMLETTVAELLPHAFGPRNLE